MNFTTKAFKNPSYCPLKLEVHKRPTGCGLPLSHPDSIVECSFCPLYQQEKNITFRGLRFAHKHPGTKEPQIIPKETFKDRRFKKLAP